MNTSKYWLAAAVSVALMGAAGAAPYPHGPVSATDLGPASSLAANEKITVTVALSLRNTAQMESLIEAVYNKESPQYQHFLTPEEFAAQFGPSAATVAAVQKQFEADGLSVSKASTAHLHVTGTAAQLEKAFSVQLHSYAVAATAKTGAFHYTAPVGAPHVAAAIAGSVRAVMGLDTRPRLTPRLVNPLKTPIQTPHTSNTTSTTDPPGEWTVFDYAQYYDLNPVYKQGATGKGRTIAILTLASFTQSDAYNYWSGIGLNVNQNRITEIQVDGGSGPPSNDAGSDETTLDVEQSGGLAPGAKIIVYEAPNTSQGFVDGFATAIDSNVAETLSTSWGEWEAFDGPDPVVGNGTVTDPVTGKQTDIIQAYDDLLAQSALQGQTWFAASGDSGAYDTARALPSAPSTGQPFSYNLPVSVDSPSAQRFMTSAGGTTVPGLQQYLGPTGNIININVAQEQAWSWRYLQPLCDAFGQTPVQCGTYPVGTGGGVSIYFNRPFYQWFTPGMASTPAGQALVQLTPAPAETLLTLPTGFPGRNVPDISTNADPQTGYLYYYTPLPADPNSPPGFYQAGGTSFVAPQLNGVTSLFVQQLHHRIGLFNPPMYLISLLPGARSGKHAAFRDITKGDNWFWYARPGYDQTTGLGVPDWANFYNYLRAISP
jgi:kumamolisin